MIDDRDFLRSPLHEDDWEEDTESLVESFFEELDRPDDEDWLFDEVWT